MRFQEENDIKNFYTHQKHAAVDPIANWWVLNDIPIKSEHDYDLSTV